MPIDATCNGRTYPPTEPVLVAQADIDAFCTAVGATAGGEAPPTFAMRLASPTWAQLFDDPELGLALARTMHAEQSFELARPFVAGDEVVGRLTIRRVRSRSESDWVSVEVELSVGEERVATASSTFICQREAS